MSLVCSKRVTVEVGVSSVCPGDSTWLLSGSGVVGFTGVNVVEFVVGLSADFLHHVGLTVRITRHVEKDTAVGVVFISEEDHITDAINWPLGLVSDSVTHDFTTAAGRKEKQR